MVGRYLGLVLGEALRPTVRWTDALQILVAAFLPIAFRTFGAPMPDGAQDMAFAYVGYAIVALVLLRILLYAPYAVWRDAFCESNRLATEIGSPSFRIRAAMEAKSIADRLAVIEFLSTHRMEDATENDDFTSVSGYDAFFGPMTRLFHEDPSLNDVVVDFEKAHKASIEWLRGLRDDPETHDPDGDEARRLRVEFLDTRARLINRLRMKDDISGSGA